MSRRAPKAELEFGSDSFLDVVCNIVGILIILILITSYHAGNAPVTAEMIDALVAEEVPVAPAIESPVAVAPAPVRLPEPETVVAEPVRPPDVPLSQELLQQRAKLLAELESLQTEKRLTDSRMNELSEANRIASAQVNAVATTLRDEREAAAKQREAVKAQTAQLENSRQELNKLQEEIKIAENEKSPVKPVKHRVTPISKTVTGKEIHFRLAENRVAFVPIDELAERLRPQIERRKETLLKFKRQEGEVGPVAGFIMRYAVERDPVPVVSDLSGGRGMVRISVTRWEINPDPDLHTETPEQALKRGSAFLRTLKMADVDCTLTFWVYPDSFDIFRQLRDFAYEEGFTVAARPLPHGVPIAGSPQGTRSAGQ